MTKSVNYSVVKRRKPNDSEATEKYYALAQSRGDVSIREMASRIEKTCTVTKADVMAVLTALEDNIIDALSNGEIVRLANIGYFQIGLNGKGASSEDQFDVSLIKKAHINFRPGLALTGMLKDLSFSKVPQKSPKKDDSEQSAEDID